MTEEERKILVACNQGRRRMVEIGSRYGAVILHDDFIFLQGAGWSGEDYVPEQGTLAERRAAIFQEIRRRRFKYLEQLRKDQTRCTKESAERADRLDKNSKKSKEYVYMSDYWTGD